MKPRSFEDCMSAEQEQELTPILEAIAVKDGIVHISTEKGLKDYEGGDILTEKCFEEGIRHHVSALIENNPVIFSGKTERKELPSDQSMKAAHEVIELCREGVYAHGLNDAKTFPGLNVNSYEVAAIIDKHMKAMNRETDERTE